MRSVEQHRAGVAEIARVPGGGLGGEVRVDMNQAKPELPRTLAAALGADAVDLRGVAVGNRAIRRNEDEHRAGGAFLHLERPVNSARSVFQLNVRGRTRLGGCLSSSGRGLWRRLLRRPLARYDGA